MKSYNFKIQRAIPKYQLENNCACMHGEFLIVLNDVGQSSNLLFLGDDLQRGITS